MFIPIHSTFYPCVSCASWSASFRQMDFQTRIVPSAGFSNFCFLSCVCCVCVCVCVCVHVHVHVHIDNWVCRVGSFLFRLALGLVGVILKCKGQGFQTSNLDSSWFLFSWWNLQSPEIPSHQSFDLVENSVIVETAAGWQRRTTRRRRR